MMVDIVFVDVIIRGVYCYASVTWKMDLGGGSEILMRIFTLQQGIGSQSFILYRGKKTLEFQSLLQTQNSQKTIVYQTLRKVRTIIAQQVLRKLEVIPQQGVRKVRILVPSRILEKLQFWCLRELLEIYFLIFSQKGRMKLEIHCLVGSQKGQKFSAYQGVRNVRFLNPIGCQKCQTFSAYWGVRKVRLLVLITELERLEI